MLSRLSAVFRSPFHGLWVVAWLFFVWTQLVYPGTLLLNGQFADSDDVIHLIRTLDWLQGQSWFDPHLTRIMPPEGIVTHFSRLAELPIAGLLAPLLAFGVTVKIATYIAAAIWPLALLAILFVVVRWTALPLVGAAWAGASAYVTLFAAQVLFYFVPGRVDHHSLSLVLQAATLGAVIRLMEQPQKPLWPILAGGFSALGFAIALESMPIVLIFTGWMGLITLIRGRSFMRACGLYALSFVLGALVLLILTESLNRLTDTDPLAFSGLYVGLAGLMGFSLGIACLATLIKSKIIRWSLGVGLPVLLGAFFLYLFPALLLGPYGGVDSEIAQHFLPYIGEAQSIARKVETIPSFFCFVLMVIIGLEASIRALNDMDDKEPYWILVLILLFVPLFLAVTYQYRFICQAALFAIFPLTHFLMRNLERARSNFQGRKLFVLECLILLVVGPLGSVLYPALIDNRSFNEGVLLYPASWQEPKNCERPGLWDALNLPTIYGDRPRLIMNNVNMAKGLLMNTGHNIIAAPYHTNPQGLRFARLFFNALDPAEAKRILVESKAELVVVCSDGIDRMDARGRVVVDVSGNIEDPGESYFSSRLLRGEKFSFLKRVDLPFIYPARLYEVVLDKKS